MAIYLNMEQEKGNHCFNKMKALGMKENAKLGQMFLKVEEYNTAGRRKVRL